MKLLKALLLTGISSLCFAGGFSGTTGGGNATLPLPAGATNYWNYPSTATFFDTLGINTSTITATSGTNPQVSVINPNFIGSFNAGVGFFFGPNPLGYINQQEANSLCSDASTTCMVSPLGYGPSNGAINFGIDQNGKLSVGSYVGSKSTATVWGNMLIGSGYPTITNAPTNGLRVQGPVIFDSSATITYGVVAGSFTANGTGAGMFTSTEGSPSSGTISGTDVLWADVSSHTFVFNPNNTSTYTVVGSSTNPTSGHLATWSGQGTLVDGGVSTGGSFINNQNTLQAGSTFYVSSGTVNGQLTVTTLNLNGTQNIKSGNSLNFNTSIGGGGATILNPDGVGNASLEIIASKGIGLNTNNPFSSQFSPGVFISSAGFAVAGSSADATTTYSGFIGTSAVSQSTLWSLPKADGTINQAIITDGSTHLSFASTPLLISTQTWTGQNTFRSLFSANFSSHTFLGTSTTASTSYVNAGSSCTITPTSTSSLIKITVNAVGTATSLAGASYYTIARGNTNLAPSNLSLTQVNDGLASAYEPLPMQIIDAPLTSSVTTYFVQQKVAGSGNAIYGILTGASVMSCEELH